MLPQEIQKAKKHFLSNTHFQTKALQNFLSYNINMFLLLFEIAVKANIPKNIAIGIRPNMIAICLNKNNTAPIGNPTIE